jgi:hypothetical protein
MRPLGTLYFSPISAGVTVWTQPGGPGTLVFPQQQPGEMIGLFSFGCGHWFNNICVVFEADTDQVQVAYLICPLCSYIQRAIKPGSDIYGSGIDANAILTA